MKLNIKDFELIFNCFYFYSLFDTSHNKCIFGIWTKKVADS